MPPRLLGIAFFVMVLVWMIGSPPQQQPQCEDGVSLMVHGLVMPLLRIPPRSSLVLFSNNNNNPLDTSWTVPEDDPNDPRVMRRMRREQQQQQNNNKNQKKKKDPASAASSYRQARSQVSKQQQASAAFDLPQQPVVKTIGGGTAMIFAMAQRMWEQERADDSSTTTPNTNNNNNNTPKNNPQASTTPITTTTTSSSSSWTVPRWRPTATQTVGISNFNPEFRTQSPPMNSQGYASTIWRNVRKRNKPSLWRHALRLYDRMEEATTTLDTNGSSSSNNKNKKTTTTTVPRTNEHYHGALLAAAKLGLWEKAMEIFDEVQERQAQQEQSSMTLSSSSSLRKPYSNSNRGGLQTSNNNMINNNNNGLANNNNKLNKPSPRVHVTDYMVVSVLYACVRASRNHQSSSEEEDDDEPLSIDERRQPLDAARAMLEQVSSQYDLILCQRHVNPLAAAYLQLRLRSDAQDLLQGWLKDRQIGPEPEDGVAPFNINDIGTKDKASYTLLVTGAVQDDDWTGAVQALSNMTRAGLYPTQRHLNAWNEVSERKTKHRTTRSWKKKRDELWIERGLR